MSHQRMLFPPHFFLFPFSFHWEFWFQHLIWPVFAKNRSLRRKFMTRVAKAVREFSERSFGIGRATWLVLFLANYEAIMHSSFISSLLLFKIDRVLRALPFLVGILLPLNWLPTFRTKKTKRWSIDLICSQEGSVHSASLSPCFCPSSL